MSRTCTKCKVEYQEPLSDNFNKRAKAKDGLQTNCRLCNSKSGKAHYQRKMAYYKNKAALWRKANVAAPLFGGWQEDGVVLTLKQIVPEALSSLKEDLIMVVKKYFEQREAIRTAQAKRTATMAKKREANENA